MANSAIVLRILILSKFRVVGANLVVDKSIKSHVNDPSVRRKMQRGEQMLRQVNLIPAQPPVSTDVPPSAQ